MNREIKILSYEDIIESCKRLSHQIQNKGWNIDVIVPILKGGANIGVLIGNELNIDEFAFIQTRSSENSEVNCQLKKPRVLGVINGHLMNGKNVLICDDIYDSGRSLKLVENVVKECGAKNIYMATSVLVNEEAKSIENFIYDFDYVAQNYWIIFPWEKQI